MAPARFKTWKGALSPAFSCIYNSLLQIRGMACRRGPAQSANTLLNDNTRL
jgi:hypothetical protein